MKQETQPARVGIPLVYEGEEANWIRYLRVLAPRACGDVPTGRGTGRCSPRMRG